MIPAEGHARRKGLRPARWTAWSGLRSALQQVKSLVARLQNKLQTFASVEQEVASGLKTTSERFESLREQVDGLRRIVREGDPERVLDSIKPIVEIWTRLTAAKRELWEVRGRLFRLGTHMESYPSQPEWTPEEANQLAGLLSERLPELEAQVGRHAERWNRAQSEGDALPAQIEAIHEELGRLRRSIEPLRPAGLDTADACAEIDDSLGRFEEEMESQIQDEEDLIREIESEARSVQTPSPSAPSIEPPPHERRADAPPSPIRVVPRREPPKPKVFLDAVPMLSELSSELKTALLETRESGSFRLGLPLQRSLMQTLKGVRQDGDSFLREVFGADETYARTFMIRHSVHVSILTMVLGLESGMNEVSLFEVGLAGLVHDIGMIHPRWSFILARGALTPQERKQVDVHPLEAEPILRNLALDHPDVLTAVVQHHEAVDGSGYPYRLKGPQIAPQGQIVGLADVIEAMTHARPYRAAVSPADCFQWLQTEGRRRFDSSLLRAAFRSIGPYPPGVDVRLSDARLARVMSRFPRAPLSPVVRVLDANGLPTGSAISLAETFQVKIES